MIPKIMAPRHDGRSSFERLEEYLTVERKPGTKETIERGPVVLSDNLFSHETAAREMRAAAVQNLLVEHPVMHFIVAWEPGERPTETEWKQSVERMIQALGFGEHQYLIAAHDDKEHFHVHVMLNRVHPETAKAHNPRLTQLTLHRLARELEHEFGWAEADGLYRWDRQRNEPVRNTKAELSRIRDKREQSPGKKPTQMAKQDHFRDEPSLKAFASKQPAATLRKLLAGKANWQQVHLALSQHGLTIQKAVKGGYTVGVEGSEVRVKASDVFRFAFSGREARARTEALLGAFEAPVVDFKRQVMPIARIAIQEITQGAPGYRAGVRLVVQPGNQPQTREGIGENRPAQAAGERSQQWLDKEAEAGRQRRQQRTEDRARERLELKREFQAVKSEQKAVLHTHTLSGRVRRAELYADCRRNKLEIRSLDVTWQGKKAMFSVAVAELVVAKQKLNREIAEERATVPTLTYQQWVERKAEAGDRRAAAQMRGWRYQDSRNLRKTDPETAKAAGELQGRRVPEPIRQSAVDWQELANERVKQLKEHPAFRQTIEGLRWKADSKTGDVLYTVHGRAALMDRGKKITVLVAEPNATRVALQMAIHKYGGVIDAKGTAAWQDQLIAAAVQDNVQVVFTDPKLQQRLRDGRQAVRDQAKQIEPDLTRARERFQYFDEDLMKRYGYGLDPAKADRLIAERMAMAGSSEAEIAGALRELSRQGREAGRTAEEGYCREAAAGAVGRIEQRTGEQKGVER